MTSPVDFTAMTQGGAFLRAISKEWPADQVERFLAGVKRCERELSCIPSYAAKAARDPEYWLLYCASRPLLYTEPGSSTPDLPPPFALP
jgi:hypothetical protein